MALKGRHYCRRGDEEPLQEGYNDHVCPSKGPRKRGSRSRQFR